MTNYELLTAIEAVARTLTERTSHPDKTGVYVNILRTIQALAIKRTEDEPL